MQTPQPEQTSALHHPDTRLPAESDTAVDDVQNILNPTLADQNDMLQQMLDLSNQQLHTAQRERKELEQLLQRAGNCNDELKQTILLMKGSKAWKLAGPMRGLAGILRTIRNPLLAEKELEIYPAAALERVSSGIYRVTGDDPQFLAPVRFRKGLYLFRWSGAASRRVLLRIFPDFGQGHLEIDSQSLGYLSSEYESHERFVQMKRNADNLRLDPGETGKNNICIGNFKYVRMGMFSAVRVGLALISKKTGRKKYRLAIHFAKLCLTGRKHEAMSHFAGAFKDFGEGRLTGNDEAAYQQYIRECEPDEAQLAEQIQKAKSFAMRPVISIIVPVFNTDRQMLVDMIESVCDQTYENWELCLADGHSQKEYIPGILQAYSTKDTRIRSVLLEENFGIAGNTNAALAMATGEYIALLDHDDLLPKWALYSVVKAINDNKNPDILYSDEDKITFDGKKRFFPHFKPEWSPDLLRSYNYITHLFVAKRDLVARAGNFLPGYDGSQDHDLILRTTELAERVVHIPEILYHWRSHSESTAQNQGNKSYTLEAGVRAISDHIKRVGYEGETSFNQKYGFYRVEYKLTAEPLVSIIIPNYEHVNDLRRCLDSIFSLTKYSNFEIIVVENNSTSKEIFAYYQQIQKKHGVQVIRWQGEFNYSAINNFAVRTAKGEFLLFLNNDTEVIAPDWIEQMLQYAQRKDVGAVGAKLYYADDTIQHGGVVLGFQGLAGHAFSRVSREDPGYMGRAIVVQNVSAVTAACMMMNKAFFESLGGFDESMKVAFNDVDLCMRIRQAGKWIIYNPYAELYHHESVSRGSEDTSEKKARFVSEIEYFHAKWKDQLEAGDPFYNPHLDLEQTPYRISGK